MSLASLSGYQQRVELQLSLMLSQQTVAEPQLAQAMRYSLLLGGKRVRPFLVYACGTMLGASLADLDGPATAIEALHSYSLIHDDLPAMDNDDLRRGQPTCHIAFDEATAILAGDALQALAFESLSQHPYQQTDSQSVVRMVQLLARAAGAAGMCGGQAIDLAQTNKATTLAILEQMHQLKTGALIECAVQLAYYCSPVRNEIVLVDLCDFARCLGLAFQVQDDILDIESDTQTLGKPQGSDQKANKATYPALLGLEGARQRAVDLYQQALAALKLLPYNTTELAEFAHFIIARKF
ncbi:(2E,6E)-farnesyl diphosphate synthase [Arsukibacterium sp.]|uniref:(2E,6E)-farnesyl diphosphate synthase n=1 Tax=Arsukibacterium sp. TaxID=1977258 RepID=UPI002FD94793